MKNLFFCSIVLLSACGSPKKTSEASDTALAVPALTQATIRKVAPAKVELIAKEAIFDSLQIPHASIRLLVNSQEVWKKSIIGDWSTLEKEQYKNYNIPPTATAVYMSWWAGTGDIFCLVQEQDKWVLKSCALGEGEEEEEMVYTYVIEKEVSVR